jgi:hypothetical protein
MDQKIVMETVLFSTKKIEIKASLIFSLKNNIRCLRKCLEIYGMDKRDSFWKLKLFILEQVFIFELLAKY